MRFSSRTSAMRSRSVSVREYPERHKDRLVEAEARRNRIGEPFELNFVDAITGRPVSIAAMRGKVIVVDFWASLL